MSLELKLVITSIFFHKQPRWKWPKFELPFVSLLILPSQILKKIKLPLILYFVPAAWPNGWVGRFRVFQLPGTVEGGGTLFWAAAFPRINSAFCAAKYSFFKSMRWSNCNSTFLLAQAAGTKYKISGNFIIFEIRLSKINNKTNGNSNCGQFHLRYIWKNFDAFSSLNLGHCYFSV